MPLPLSVGQFAVFRRRHGQAHFKVLHETYEAATAEAVRLLTTAQANGQCGQCFFVAQVQAFFRFNEAGEPEHRELGK